MFLEQFRSLACVSNPLLMRKQSMDVACQFPTRGQLQRSLAQEVQKLYREHLGHTAGKVICQLFEQQLTLVIEDSITQPEQLIAEEGDLDLAEKVRSDLDSAIRPKLAVLINQVLGVNVVDILSDAAFQTGRTAIVIILDEQPIVREPKGR